MGAGQRALESMVDGFWAGKKVFMTGHTGFKGAWLALWLQSVGAEVTGYALPPPTMPSLFEVAGVGAGMHSINGDIRQLESMQQAIEAAQPEVVFHMAAQPLVRYGYENPVETYETNVMGTVHVLECIRRTRSVVAAIMVTSDKCYENKEWAWGYRETDRLGGYDPYSNSKGCSELVVSAYRQSYFEAADSDARTVSVATVRAGNVIGGGDWAADRLIPDIVRALSRRESVSIRYPRAIRPWQHVLEPLSGYLLLARRLMEDGARYTGAWNFGPSEAGEQPVSFIADRISALWGAGASWRRDEAEHWHEAGYLKLDSSKARMSLGWHPQWDLERALAMVVEWYRGFYEGKNMRELSLAQLAAYFKAEQVSMGDSGG